MSENQTFTSGGATGDYKPVTAFHPLKEMPAETVIEGRHLGRFESKKRPGAHFHLFERSNGEVHGYGSCKVLDDRIEQVKTSAKDAGVNPADLYMTTKFLGRLPNKGNSNTSYQFTAVEAVVKPSEASKPSTDITTETSGEINVSEIPF